MSLAPAFKIGVWNAWIFVLGVVLIGYGLRNLIVNKKAMLFIWPLYNKKEKKLSSILMVTYFASWIYTIFLPLKLGTIWFYAGLSIYLLGMVFVTMATLNFATTPLDKLVTKGIYRISRNPMDFGGFLIFIGIGIACASWIFLLMAMLYIILQHILVIPEERMCLEKFGNVYREYMNKTPKWIGMPKSESK
jgi:protein-S-isoprenylcysteine O-methyltransferase Ste14